MSADMNNGPGRLEEPFLVLCERNVRADREKVPLTAKCSPDYAGTPVTLERGPSRQKETNKRCVGFADIADARSTLKKKNASMNAVG